jgi:hypothetical protein
MPAKATHLCPLTVLLCCSALAGTKLIVLHQTDSWYLAVSSRKKLCLAALNLPSGVLLVSFDRGIPTVVLSAIHQALGPHQAGGTAEAGPHTGNPARGPPLVPAC